MLRKRTFSFGCAFVLAAATLAAKGIEIEFDSSLRAGAYAAGLARRQGAKLILLFVKVSSPTAIVAPEAAIAKDESRDQIAAELLQQLEENAPRLGLDAEFVVREGNSHTELLRLAE